MKHRATIFRYLIVGIVSLSAALILYWLYSVPTEAVSVKPHPIPVITTIVKDDGTCKALGFSKCVVLKFTRCKNVEARGRVVTTLVSDKTQLLLPASSDNSERGCLSDIQLPFPIPPQTAPDKYHLHFRATYQINPLKTITQDFDSEEFEITGAVNQGPQGVQGEKGEKGETGDSGI